MAPVKPDGNCVMGCGRRGTMYNGFYCAPCYDKLRRGGFDKHPELTWVSGSDRAKGHFRIVWKCGKPEPLSYQRVKPGDPRPKCSVPDCTNLARRRGMCDRHNPAAAAREQRHLKAKRDAYARRRDDV